MAKVEYAFPVDKIHGRISKNHVVGFAHRVASKCNYTTTYGQRTTPATEQEIAHRTKFGAVSKATHLRMKDPEKQAADSAAFRAQNEYKTLYSFIFHLLWEEYEA